MKKIFEQKKKISWIQYSIPILALIISILSLYIAALSLNVSEGVREDNRAIAGLEIAPQIQFRAQFYKAKSDVAERPANFVIANKGAVSAAQTTVELIYHEFNPDANQPDFSFSGTGPEFFEIGELEPLEVEAFWVDQNFLDYPSQYKGRESNYPVLEVRIKYRRDVDKKLYVARAVYFYNNEGMWVSKTDNSLGNDTVYNDIQTFFEKKYYNSEALNFSDQLFYVDFNNIDFYPGEKKE